MRGELDIHDLFKIVIDGQAVLCAEIQRLRWNVETKDEPPEKQYLKWIDDWKQDTAAIIQDLVNN